MKGLLKKIVGALTPTKKRKHNDKLITIVGATQVIVTPTEIKMEVNND